MATQREFDWTKAERQQCIDDAVLTPGVAKDGSPVGKQAQANLLRSINDFLGNNCEAWPSQKTLAQKMKVTVKTVQRAAQALQKKNLLIIDPRPCRSGTQNFYRVIWNDLRLLSIHSKRQTECPAVEQRPSDILTEPSDILTEPSDILTEPSDILTAELLRTKQEPTTTTTDPVVVVVRSLGFSKEEEAIASVKRLGLTLRDVEERIAAWRSLPTEKQITGTLYNWLTKRNSFTAPRVRVERDWSPQVDHKLDAELRRSRAVQWLRSQLGRLPTDREVDELLLRTERQNGNQN